MDIDESGYWKPHVSDSPALSVPQTSKAVAARKKKKLMFPLTHLSLKIFPNGTAYDMIWCKYSKPQLIPSKVILKKICNTVD